MTAQFISQHGRRRNRPLALFTVVFTAATLALAMVASAIWLIRLMTPLPDQPLPQTPSLFPSFEAPAQIDPPPTVEEAPEAAKTRRAPRARAPKAGAAPADAAPFDPFADVEVVPVDELAAISQAR